MAAQNRIAIIPLRERADDNDDDDINESAPLKTDATPKESKEASSDESSASSSIEED